MGRFSKISNLNPDYQKAVSAERRKIQTAVISRILGHLRQACLLAMPGISIARGLLRFRTSVRRKKAYLVCTEKPIPSSRISIAGAGIRELAGLPPRT